MLYKLVFLVDLVEGEVGLGLSCLKVVENELVLGGLLWLERSKWPRGGDVAVPVVVFLGCVHINVRLAMSRYLNPAVC